MTLKTKVYKPVKYVWAYGSNLSFEQMKRRCPNAEPIRKLYLQDGALVFRGVADVIGKKGSKVAGGLWKITRACEQRLDMYEGVKGGLYRKLYLTLEVDGEVEDCLFYKMNSRGVMPPSEHYLETIIQGYKDFGLDFDLLEAALAHSRKKKNLTPDVIRRHQRRGYPKLAREWPKIKKGTGAQAAE